MNRARYRDRAEAGQTLADSLTAYRGDPGVVVLGLARGGVPVAAAVAREIGAELDVAIVRKLGVPGHEELALGAITRDRMVVNDDLVRSLRLPRDVVDTVVEREQVELVRRENAYRGGRSAAAMTGRTVILVDDGIATGASMRAVALDARGAGARRVVVAVPTAPVVARDEFADVADEFVCSYAPTPFIAVGMSYAVFRQTTDDEVRALLSLS